MSRYEHALAEMEHIEQAMEDEKYIIDYCMAIKAKEKKQSQKGNTYNGKQIHHDLIR